MKFNTSVFWNKIRNTITLYLENEIDIANKMKYKLNRFIRRRIRRFIRKINLRIKLRLIRRIIRIINIICLLVQLY